MEARHLLPSWQLWQIEPYLQKHFHRSFELNSHIDGFVSTACVAYLCARLYVLGWIHRYRTVLIGSSFGIMLWFVRTLMDVHVDPAHIMKHEYQLVQSLRGEVSLIAFQASFLIFLLELEKLKVNWPSILRFIGRSSLYYFLLHRIIFAKIIVPIQLNLHLIKPTGHVELLNIYGSILIVIGLSWIFKKSRIFEAVR